MNLKRGINRVRTILAFVLLIGWSVLIIQACSSQARPLAPDEQTFLLVMWLAAWLITTPVVVMSLWYLQWITLWLVRGFRKD